MFGEVFEQQSATTDSSKVSLLTKQWGSAVNATFVKHSISPQNITKQTNSNVSLLCIKLCSTPQKALQQRMIDARNSEFHPASRGQEHLLCLSSSFYALHHALCFMPFKSLSTIKIVQAVCNLKVRQVI